MSTMRTFVLAAALLASAGCGPSTGGSHNGDLANAVAAGTAPYALLDLTSGKVTYLAALPDAQSNATYKNGVMAFRRVGKDGAELFIGIFEVTQAQWQRLDPAGAPWPWQASAIAPVVASGAISGDHPAFNISYDMLTPAVAAFAPASGARLRVPTSAQWEAAVGVSSGYAWGTQADRASLVAQATVRETVITATNASSRVSGAGLIDNGGPEAVGSRTAAPTGVFDIHGNVWEWTSGGTEVRGGSWYDTASLARAEVRAGAGQGLAADVDHALIGARLVLIP